MADFLEFTNYMTQSKESMKNIDPLKNLYQLNNLANSFAGKVIQQLYNDKVYKVIPQVVASVKHGQVEDNSQYGHISCGQNYFRLSTCISKDSYSVQVPHTEAEHFNEHSYIFFTTGDLFLIVKSSELLKAHPYFSDKKNDVYSIPTLFTDNLIENYGLYEKASGIVQLKDHKNCNIDYVKLTPNFDKVFLRGCTASSDAKYALVRTSMVESKNDLSINFFNSAAAIKKFIANKMDYSTQYITRCSRMNTESLNKCCKPEKEIFLKSSDKHKYIVVKEDNIEKIFNYVNIINND